MESELLKLEVVHNVRVIQCGKNELVGEWLLTVTREIASGPDTIARTMIVDENVCTDDGHGTGKDAAECWHKMLLTFHGVTPATATAIQRQYPSLREFRRACHKWPSAEIAERQLGDLELDRSHDPSRPSIRRMGRELAIRLWTAMTSQDPSLQMR